PFLATPLPLSLELACPPLGISALPLHLRGGGPCVAFPGCTLTGVLPLARLRVPHTFRMRLSLPRPQELAAHGIPAFLPSEDRAPRLARSRIGPQGMLC